MAMNMDGVLVYTYAVYLSSSCSLVFFVAVFVPAFSADCNSAFSLAAHKRSFSTPGCNFCLTVERVELEVSVPLLSVSDRPQEIFLHSKL